MNCPVCKKPMIILEFHQVELDYCPGCGGCWLDQGELELLLDISGKSIDLSDFTNAPRSKRRCPLCRKKLLRDYFPHTETEVDICPRDGGIWLDRGELVDIAEKYQNNNAVKNLREFFNSLFKG